MTTRPTRSPSRLESRALAGMYVVLALAVGVPVILLLVMAAVAQ